MNNEGQIQLDQTFDALRERVNEIGQDRLGGENFELLLNGIDFISNTVNFLNSAGREIAERSGFPLNASDIQKLDRFVDGLGALGITTAIGDPASRSLIVAMICSSVNRERFIIRLQIVGTNSTQKWKSFKVSSQII